MAEAMDVEAASAAEGESAHHRWLAALIGVAALLAALLATLEMHSDMHEQAAFTRASRLSSDISSRIAATTAFTSFQAGAVQEALALAAEAQGRALASQQAAGRAEVEAHAAEAEGRAAERLLEAAEAMGAVPSTESGVDERTRHVLAADITHLQSAVGEQNRQVDRAEVYGSRESRSIFALSLVAVAAVLLGLAGIVGAGRPGRIVLVAAGAALVLALGWGVSALLL